MFVQFGPIQVPSGVGGTGTGIVVRILCVCSTREFELELV